MGKEEEKSKKRNKSAITQDVSTLLLRYSVKTVLTLLQEVAKVAGEKIDWNEIVRKTATGIPSARECQMLWRHLAYGESLTDHFDHAANPMDDDSDLENEMQAFPAVNREASEEASAYVKVLNASKYPIDSHVPNNWTIEAPLAINIPKFKVHADSSLPANAMLGTNVSIRVSVEREKLLSRPCGEKRPNDGISGDGVASKRKRKVWSTEDDVKLTAAMQKHGEQKWAIIASEDFNNDRKASELSQRWANIRKKKGNLIAGTGSGLSEAQKAASRAILIALEPDRMKAVPHMSNGPPKSQVPTGRPSANCVMDSTAAGSGIAAPTDASSVIQAAACSQNVVNMRTEVGSSTSMPKQPSSNTSFSCNGPIKRAISTSTTLPVGFDEVSASASEKTLAERDRGAMGLISECHPAVGDQSTQKVDEGQNSASCNKLGRNTQGDRASISLSDPINQTQGVSRCWQVENNGKRHADGVTTGEGIRETTEIAGGD